MPHPNEALVRQAYEAFGKGDLPGFLALCDDSMVFTVPGSAAFAGTYTKATFPGMVMQVMEKSAGTFGEAIVELVANDERAVAVLDHWLERDGMRIEYRTDHIWGIKDGKLISWQERPGSQADFDRIWA
ncbi:MAG TPA: nuclear transport factor 2 family protein [Dehalococcoidia bacterium]|jgi:ketosteroid isomerase-like protein|nr:nuclear transport factor 2 family protein [Dehalococcoidia bacterium]